MRTASASAEATRLQALRPALELRRKMLSAIRTFFQNAGYLEITTPILISAPPPEPHIDAQPAGKLYLRTSPELHMKRLIAAGYTRIFQIGPCFRQNESGELHRPEFTMLEWYRAPANYMDILEETRDLLRHIESALSTQLFEASWNIQRVSDIFVEQAGWDPAVNFDPLRFDLDLVEKVEPSFQKDKPHVLIDYPLPLAAMARKKKNDPLRAERWELYVQGLELANAYSELWNYEEQKVRFMEWEKQRRKMGKPLYPEDELFMQALRDSTVEFGGIALGIDRLAMVLTGRSSINEVNAF